MGGNIQILLFAAYVVLMHRDGRQLDPADRERPAAVDGLLAAFVGALKVSQVHAWLYVLRRRPAAAVIGLVAFALLAVVTLPVVGLPLWFDWLSQAGRSGDPSWPYIGAPLSILVGLPRRPRPGRPVRAGRLRRATPSRERLDRDPHPGRCAVAPHVHVAVPAPGDAPHPAGDRAGRGHPRRDVRGVLHLGRHRAGGLVVGRDGSVAGGARRAQDHRGRLRR